MHLDQDHRSILLQAFKAVHKEKGNVKADGPADNQKNQRIKYEDMISSQTIHIGESSRLKRPVGVTNQEKRIVVQSEYLGTEKVASMLSQNARLFAQNMAELISIKLEEKMVLNGQ